MIRDGCCSAIAAWTKESIVRDWITPGVAEAQRAARRGGGRGYANFWLIQGVSRYFPRSSTAVRTTRAQDADAAFKLLRATMSRLRPLIRLPTVLFPGQACSFIRVTGSSAEPLSFQLSSAVLQLAWKEHEGRIAAFGPCARIGTELHVTFDDVLDAVEPTPSGVVHAVAGDRVRLSRTIGLGEQPALSEVEPIADDKLSPVRAERLEDEALAAHELIARGTSTGAFTLESSALDEEIGGGELICNPRCHPLHSLQDEIPLDGAQLSLWLGARLPLSTSLRVSLLSSLCPLKRLQDTVDAMRLLCDPQRVHRKGHRFRLVVSHAARDDHCGTGLSGHQEPRVTVTEALPSACVRTTARARRHGSLSVSA